MIRRCCSILFFAISLCLAGKPVVPDAAFILNKIRSPQQLLNPSILHQYCVDVNLSGSVSDEMTKVITDLGLEPPVYKEHYNGKRFSLFLANENYPVQTRELLSGIMNPAEMIDLVVSSIVKYHDIKQIQRMTAEANQVITARDSAGIKILHLQLTPKDKRFAYSSSDMGAYMEESWLSSLEATIDTSHWLIKDLTVKKFQRRFDAAGKAAPAVDSGISRFVFGYKIINNKTILPERLDYYANEAYTFSVNATYRTEKGRYVFATKEICVLKDQIKTECLQMRYGTYHAGECKQFETPVMKAAYGKSISEAAALSTKASDQLRSGNITEAMHVLNILVDKYPGTPQAIEAKRLLNKIPQSIR